MWTCYQVRIHKKQFSNRMVMLLKLQLIFPSISKVSVLLFISNSINLKDLWTIPKGRKFMVKEISKNIGDIISKNQFGGSLRLKFRSLCLEIKKETQALPQEKRVSLIYWDRVLNEMHLRLPEEAQQVQKVDLNWTCPFVHMGMEWYVCELVHFSVPFEFWTYSGPACCVCFYTSLWMQPLSYWPFEMDRSIPA